MTDKPKIQFNLVNFSYAEKRLTGFISDNNKKEAEKEKVRHALDVGVAGLGFAACKVVIDSHTPEAFMAGMSTLIITLGMIEAMDSLAAHRVYKYTMRTQAAEDLLHDYAVMDKEKVNFPKRLPAALDRYGKYHDYPGYDRKKDPAHSYLMSAMYAFLGATALYATFQVDWTKLAKDIGTNHHQNAVINDNRRPKIKLDRTR